MKPRSELGESLPALLERRWGIPRRTTLLATGALVVATVLVYLLFIRDPFYGRDQYVHRKPPVFNVLLTPGVVERVAPRPGEFVRLHARQGPVRASATVRPLRLPAYRGDVSGLLPVYTDGRTRRLARSVPNFEVTLDGKARVHAAPGYQVGFSYGSPAFPREGVDIIVIPPEMPRARDGVILSYRAVRPAGRLPPRQRRVIRAMRSAFRSFEFGPDRL